MFSFEPFCNDESTIKEPLLSFISFMFTNVSLAFYSISDVAIIHMFYSVIQSCYLKPFIFKPFISDQETYDT